MLSFFAAIFAIAGALAATGPFLIHLLNRRRFRTVEWAAMDFLRLAVKRSRRAIELRDLLLLALRTLCVLLFGLALARPYLSRSSMAVDPDQPVHAVLVLDNSLSMSYRQLGGTLLDEAKRKARDFMERLPEGSRISILPLCGSANGFSRNAYRTREDALEALAAVEATDRAGAAARAIELAALACDTEPDLPSKRVVFLGDHQRSTWPAGASSDAARTLPEMQVVQVRAAAPSNTWIADLRVRDRLADTDSTTVFLVTVRHEGPAPRTDVQVSLAIDGAVVSTRAVDLEPGQSRELEFSYTFDLPIEPGETAFARAAVFLPADALTADDRRYLAVPVVAELPVVFVDQYGADEDPQKNRYGETFHLRRLLAPLTTRGGAQRQLVEIRHLGPDDLRREVLQDARLVVIAGLESPEPAVGLLREYVEQGGQLIIAAGAEFDPRRWTESAWLDGDGILPAPLDDAPLGRLPDATIEDLTPFRLDVESTSEEYFLIEQVTRQELADLYGLPYFFKAVRMRVDDEIEAGLLEREKARLVRQQRERELSDSKTATTSPGTSREESPEKPEEQERDEVVEGVNDLSGDRRWLLWSPPGRDVPRRSARSVEQVARGTLPRVLARYTNGAPFLVERTLGDGDVLFLSSSVYSNWNTLTRTHAVLLLDRILRSKIRRTLPRRNLDEIEGLRLAVDAADRRRRFVLTRPDGLQEDLSVDALGEDRYGIRVRDLLHHGHYTITADAAATANGGALDGNGIDSNSAIGKELFALNGLDVESRLDYLDRGSFEERVGTSDYGWVSSDEAISTAGAWIVGHDLWKWLLDAALVGLLAESLLVGRLSASTAPQKESA